MAQLLDLMASPELRVEPEPGRTEPLLWVRRLVVWSEPGVVLQNISLRRGLNIVWSPDPADRGETDESGGALGHGSGKTLFCRLLRFCLGEERFAPDGLRDRIAIAFKDGMVGAEVVVDGTAWAIVRHFGSRRTAIVVPGGDLDALAGGTVKPTGMAPLLEAIQDRIISDDVAALMPGAEKRMSWLIALAWLTRDQECRFDDVLDWRSANSESDSPVRGFSATRTLDALRALVGAITPEEHELRQEVSRFEDSRNHAEQEADHRAWEASQKRTRLAEALNLRQDELPTGPLEAEVFKKAAGDQLAKVDRVDSNTDATDLDALRTTHDEARDRTEALDRELAQVQARIPEIERMVNRIEGERPGVSFAAHQSEHPVCPICEVPIDRALAEGCKLSHKLPDLEEARERQEKLEQDLGEEMRRLDSHRGAVKRLTAELKEARQHTSQLRRRVEGADRARDARKDSWYAARRLIDDANRLAEEHSTTGTAQGEVQRLTDLINTKRDQAAKYRERSARVFQRVSEAFNAIVHTLAGPGASGRIALDGNGLHLTIELGGERSTAAIDSLKVLAFDLAVLCVSIEGSTHLPAFLLHDSPREADLGLSAYHRLFRFARTLEEIGKQPLFQYIVTTTTRPPDELTMTPWLCLTLEGAPPDRRLLRKDL